MSTKNEQHTHTHTCILSALGAEGAYLSEEHPAGGGASSVTPPSSSWWSVGWNRTDVCVQLISSCGCLLKEVLHLNLHHHWLMALKMSNGINASGNKGFKKYENRVHSQNALLGPFLNSTSAFCLFTVTFLVWHTSITKCHYTQISKKKITFTGLCAWVTRRNHKISQSRPHWMHSGLF